MSAPHGNQPERPGANRVSERQGRPGRPWADAAALSKSWEGACELCPGGPVYCPGTVALLSGRGASQREPGLRQGRGTAPPPARSHQGGRRPPPLAPRQEGTQQLCPGIPGPGCPWGHRLGFGSVHPPPQGAEGPECSGPCTVPRARQRREPQVPVQHSPLKTSGGGATETGLQGAPNPQLGLGPGPPAGLRPSHGCVRCSNLPSPAPGSPL